MRRGKKMIGDQPKESLLTKEQMKELDKEWRAYKNGEGENYTWEEVKARIFKKLNTLKS